MLVILPYTEHFCNWDKFPAASNDLEFQIICCLCAIGMFLAFARQLKFAPDKFRAAFSYAFLRLTDSRPSADHSAPLPNNPVIPLRI